MGSYPQCVVDGVLFLILRHHQGKRVSSRAGEFNLGQIVRAVDSDAINEGRRVSCRYSTESDDLILMHK